MPIGLLIITSIPTTIGVCEALSAQKKADAAAKEKAKFNLVVNASFDGLDPVDCFCVLEGGNLWVDHPSFPASGHKFMGYHFMYPSEAQQLGLVSAVSDDPPMLNWIFADKDTGMVRHGSRQDTLGGHTVGPWYWSDDEEWLTLEADSASFVAIHVDKRWAIAWNKDAKFTTSLDELGRKWIPVMLKRRPLLGIDSRYVKGEDGKDGE